ncbi:MAG TPA: GNAT family N-acetyltransferase [Galbitalea sp.]|nr:GNAT family N-acetyltransferase [Galbitalea sp.]
MDVTSFTISAATSVDQARGLLRSATPPNDSFTQTSNFSDEKIDRALRLGFRRPAWVWFAADESGTVLGIVAGWGAESRTTADILDFLDLPEDPEIAHALLERAVADSTEPGRRTFEVIHFLPSESSLDDPDLAALIATLAASGFRMLVRRHRFRLPVRTAAITIPDTELTFEPIAGADDPRLVQVMGEILVGSLDAHDVAALAKGDLETVAAETVTEFLGYDPADSFFLGRDPAGAVVGLVVGGLRGSPEIGVASFIGVSHLHRGRGYAAQLLGWITARVIADNAQFVIGETDDDNFPMAAAFTRVGYPHTESRIDFVREL